MDADETFTERFERLQREAQVAALVATLEATADDEPIRRDDPL